MTIDKNKSKNSDLPHAAKKAGCLTALPLVLTMHATTANAENAFSDDVFANLDVIAISELGEMRGGVKLGLFDAKIGLEIATVADDILVKTKISTDINGIIDSVKSEVHSIVDDIKAGNNGIGKGLGKGLGNGKGLGLDKSSSFTIETPGIDHEGTVGENTGIPFIPEIKVPDIDSTTPAIEIPSTPISPISVEVEETPLTETIDQATSITLPTVDTAPIEETLDAGIGSATDKVRLATSDLGTAVEIPHNDGITKIFHDTLNGHQTVIENDANNIAISQTYSLNLHLLNFNDIAKVAKTQQITSAIQASVLQGLLK